MKLDRRYLSENNSYEGQIPQYIVIHNTDNYNIGADAKAHAKAQYNGNFNGIPANRVVQHYDVCAKNCPSAIRAKGDWERFKKTVGDGFSEKSPHQVQRILLTEKVEVRFPEISMGYTGLAVHLLQIVLKVEADGIFGEKTEKALRVFQKNNSLVQDGICGKKSWMSVVEAMKANTFAYN